MADIKPKLLIVDDDEEIRTQMKWALSRDFDLITAGDRPEAIECFRRERPLTTLLDLGLPPQPNEPDEASRRWVSFFRSTRRQRSSSSRVRVRRKMPSKR